MSKVDRFWSHDAQNIRCVRESDYDALNAELAALKAGQGEAVATYMGTDWDAQHQFLAQCADLDCGTDLYTAPPASGVIDPGWRCFQCDEHFTDEESAGLHFGAHQWQRPACLIDVAEYRAMEARMHSYNEEDAEIHRAMNRMHGQHRTALQREEEKGYARALKDTGYDENSVKVPRELLVRHLNEIGEYAWAESTDEQLRALLAQQEVKS